jgi:hypothetical protein
MKPRKDLSEKKMDKTNTSRGVRRLVEIDKAHKEEHKKPKGERHA